MGERERAPSERRASASEASIPSSDRREREYQRRRRAFSEAVVGRPRMPFSASEARISPSDQRERECMPRRAKRENSSFQARGYLERPEGARVPAPQASISRRRRRTAEIASCRAKRGYLERPEGARILSRRAKRENSSPRAKRGYLERPQSARLPLSSSGATISALQARISRGRRRTAEIASCLAKRALVLGSEARLRHVRRSQSFACRRQRFPQQAVRRARMVVIECV